MRPFLGSQPLCWRLVRAQGGPCGPCNDPPAIGWRWTKAVSPRCSSIIVLSPALVGQPTLCYLPPLLSTGSTLWMVQWRTFFNLLFLFGQVSRGGWLKAVGMVTLFLMAEPYHLTALWCCTVYPIVEVFTCSRTFSVLVTEYGGSKVCGVVMILFLSSAEELIHNWCNYYLEICKKKSS